MSDQFSQQSPQQAHQQRIRNALTIVSYMLIVIALLWSALLAYMGAWKYILIEVFLMVVGALTLVLNAKGYIRSAIYVLITNLFLCTLGLSLFIDLPSDTAPRTAQNYFLALAFLNYWILSGENHLLRISSFVVCILAFVVFSSTLFGIPIAELGAAEEVRVVGAWFNSFLAILMTCVVIYVFFTDFRLRTQAEKELSLALPRDQLELYYQGQVNTAGDVHGVEALVRWNHPERGIVSPVEFIPLAEKTGLIVSLGRLVLFKACEQLLAWSKHAATADLSLSVNVSVQEINEDDFVENVIATIEKTGIDANKLKFELTENVLILNADSIINKMQTLNGYGVKFSLDDFGTGFSSLSYLKSLPLNQLKIDRSFINHMMKNQKEAKIVKSTISLGQDLGFDVIAEGVETEQQLAYLQKLNCKLFQGYLFNRPMPKDDFEAYLKTKTVMA